MWTRYSLSVALLIAVGCGVNVHPRIPRDAAVQPQGDIAAGQAAHGVPDTIGYGTFTVFAIPVAPVHISNGQGDQLVMQAIRDALQGAGYQVVDEGSDHQRSLQCRVTRFSFRNYTWLMPIVITWGGIDLELQVVGADGQPMWQRAYTGKSTNLTYSFERAVNNSLQEIVDKAVQDFKDPGFHRACCETAAVAVPQPKHAEDPSSDEGR